MFQVKKSFKEVLLSKCRQSKGNKNVVRQQKPETVGRQHSLLEEVKDGNNVSAALCECEP